jgi:hypothetical protein
MKSYFRTFATVLLLAIPSPIFAEEVFFRGMVTYGQQHYAVFGAVRGSGTTWEGYTLLFNADWDYYFANVTTAPNGAARSQRTTANGQAATTGTSIGTAGHSTDGRVSIQPGASQHTTAGTSASPNLQSSTIGQGNAGTAQFPGSSQSSQGQGLNAIQIGQANGNSGSTHASGARTGSAHATAAGQVTNLNLVGIIVASSQVATENTSIRVQVDPGTGNITVTTNTGAELTGPGMVVVRANPSPFGSAETAQSAGRQP